MLLRVLCAVPAVVHRRLSVLLAGEPVRLERVTGSLRPAVLRGTVDLLITERSRMGADPARFLSRIDGLRDSPATIVLWDAEDTEQRALLLARGALAVLNHNLPDETLAEALRALALRRREVLLHRFQPRVRDAEPGLVDFVSDSPAMQRFLAVAHKVVDSDSTLLILGETGVGKELLARAMHVEGPRGKGSFVPVNCGALSEQLLESELFGHEEGAFTGAVGAHRGVFELAHGGTLFLDEVGDMPPPLQVKLLRALQERCIRPVGGEHDVDLDVRLIAATNRDLQQEVRAGRFRADLYYRLAVVALTIPPLRERRTDIPQLVRNHLEVLCARFNKPCAVPAEAMESLQRYDWPGNVRELVNVLERAVLLADGPTLAAQDLPEAITRSEVDRKPAQDDDHLYGLPLSVALSRLGAAFERSYLERLLRETGGRVGVTAARAGITPRSLWTKMQRLGLSKEAYRSARE